MRGTNNIYDTAEAKGILVLAFPMQKLEALSCIDEKGRCSIGIDPKKLKDATDEREKLAHELGHCVTGAFYNSHSPLDLPSRHEARACRWAATFLVPKDELEAALREHRSIYELAERFSVREETVKLAIALHLQKHPSPVFAEDTYN